jgi:hypothetical protein
VRGKSVLALVVSLVLAACGPRPTTPGMAGAPLTVDPYPPTFRYHDDQGRAARAAAIAVELEVDPEDLHVDPLGCVHSIAFPVQPRAPDEPGASFSDREIDGWARFFTDHGATFCLPPEIPIRVERNPGGGLHVYRGGDRSRSLRLTKANEPDRAGGYRYLVRADGSFWRPPVLPTTQIALDQIVGDLIGRRFTFRMTASGGSGPKCQGCPGPPPDLDLGSIDATAALEDFVASGPVLQLVCGPGPSLELRRVLVVAFRPGVEEVAARSNVPADRSVHARLRRLSPDRDPSEYSLVGAAVDAEAFPTRTVDAVTGDPVATPGWRFEHEPAPHDLCPTDEPSSSP